MADLDEVLMLTRSILASKKHAITFNELNSIHILFFLYLNKYNLF